MIAWSSLSAYGPYTLEESGLQGPAGLYDGFEGYRTPSAEDYTRLFASGLVVPDANVLLNLYRYTPEARDDLLRVMVQLRDRLWVPHQVLAEFWRNRERVLRDPRDTAKTESEIAVARDEAIAGVRAWINRVYLTEDQSTELVTVLRSGFDAVIERIRELADSSAKESARDTDKDPVLRRLEPILAGRVGAKLAPGDQEKAVAEGLRRVDAKEPPGYRDKKKADDDAAGDYLVWEQILREAEARNSDVLFITGDVKDDWWRQEGGESRGPRLELVEEMRQRAGRRLFMVRPPVFLSLARDHLRVVIREESVEAANRVERLQEEARHDRWSRWETARRIESAVFSRLEEIARPSYEVRTQYRGVRDLQLDALMVSSDDRLPDVIVEIKFVRGADALRRVGRAAIDQTLAGVARYEATGRPAMGWLIVVSDPASQRSMDRFLTLAESTEERVLITVVTEDDIGSLELPERLIPSS